MVKQISFIYEGVPYFTFEGSDFLREEFKSNAATQKDLLMKASYSMVMRRLNDNKPTFAIDFPKVKDHVIEVVDGFYNVTGTVEVEGTVYPVKLTKDGLIFEGLDEPEPEPVVEEQIPELATVVSESEEETAVVEEPTTEGPVVEEEPVVVEEPEPVVAEPAPEPFVEEPAPEPEPVVAIEHKPESESVVEEPKPAFVPEQDVIVSGTLPNGASFAVKGVTIQPKPEVLKTASNKKVKHAGMTFGDSFNGAPSGIQLGNPGATTGCMFRDSQLVQVTPRRSQTARGGFSALRGSRQKPTLVAVPYAYNMQRQPLSDIQYVKPEPEPKPEPVPEPAPVTQSDEQLQESWAKQSSIGNREKPEAAPAPIEEIVAQARERNGIRDVTRKLPEPLVPDDEPVAEESPVDKTAAKQEARSKFSNEVNAVIGDIPVELLGAIEEFTSHPIDTTSLQDMGELFCIDNRWHKQGKWFCIDVIPDSARYFFNARLNVSIEIKISDLRLWASALG